MVARKEDLLLRKLALLLLLFLNCSPARVAPPYEVEETYRTCDAEQTCTPATRTLK